MPPSKAEIEKIREALPMYRERVRVTTPVGEVSRTKQSFTDECDINKIIQKHARTGVLEHGSDRMPTYGDFSGAVDLHTAMQLVAAAEDEFEALPSAVRDLCKNDPEILLRALADPVETAALHRAGLPMSEAYEPPQEEPHEAPQGEAPPREEVSQTEGG